MRCAILSEVYPVNAHWCNLFNSPAMSGNGDDVNKLTDVGLYGVKRAPLKRVNNTSGIVGSAVGGGQQGVSVNRKGAKKKRRGRPTKRSSSKK